MSPRPMLLFPLRWSEARTPCATGPWTATEQKRDRPAGLSLKTIIEHMIGIVNKTHDLNIMVTEDKECASELRLPKTRR